ncbi:MAG: thermonuclease family protein [Pirellulaceae bacterium]|jgi:micrococcal nuclease|nr:thermonuclease family protein [Thermoguttaceae bacterium]MDI9445602.1 thermonuclease family protein [Planctomycetota bacterium]NLZ02335.1 thermonuclease family protein [Pirellulaceae bacterium]
MPGAIHQPMRRRIGRPMTVAAPVLLAALAQLWLSSDCRPRDPEALGEGFHRVARVVDGDTLLLDNGARVRLIGVDTPETVKPDSAVEAFGPEAAAYTGRFVADAGGRVYLRFDRERKDRFDRFLAYVFHDERMLNEELVFHGLARARTEFSYSEAVKRRLRQAEADAKTAGRGIWGPDEHR